MGFGTVNLIGIQMMTDAITHKMVPMTIWIAMTPEYSSTSEAVIAENRSCPSGTSVLIQRDIARTKFKGGYQNSKEGQGGGIRTTKI